MSKNVNINDQLIVPEKDIMAIVPYEEKTTSEPLVWVKYKKLDATIRFDTIRERNDALKRLIPRLTGKYIVIKDIYAINPGSIKSVHAQEKKLKIVTEFSYPFNFIFIQTEEEESSTYIKLIFDELEL